MEAPLRRAGVLHALCNAHHVRELEGARRYREEVAARMRRLLRRACHAANLAREQSHRSRLLIALIEQRYDAVVAEGLAFPRPAPLARSA